MDISPVGSVNISHLRAIPDMGRAKEKDMEQARRAAQEFEAFFLSQMFNHMFSGIGEDVPPQFGGGHAERLWRPLLIEEYAKHTAAAGGIGIADKIIDVIIRAKGMENE